MKKINLLLATVLLLVIACQKQSVSSNDVLELNPDQVVKVYFESWNNKNYNVMYSLISDGFKKIEPTAKTFEDFKSNMGKFYDTANGVEVIEAKETYNNGKEAGVAYKIKITNKDGTEKDFDSTYTLKKRINGWKLIHAYGKNIDTT